ncbi:MAG: hypothetical protein P9M14_11085 [Candidatus Alcyoniella australis]|nr:hypothetical protein [Candidatus Alcyoniella australis]
MSAKPAGKHPRLRRLLLNLLSLPAAAILRLWCLSCRVVAREDEQREIDAVQRHGGCIYPT